MQVKRRMERRIEKNQQKNCNHWWMYISRKKKYNIEKLTAVNFSKSVWNLLYSRFNTALYLLHDVHFGFGISWFMIKLTLVGSLKLFNFKSLTSNTNLNLYISCLILTNSENAVILG